MMKNEKKLKQIYKKKKEEEKKNNLIFSDRSGSPIVRETQARNFEGKDEAFANSGGELS